MSLGALLLVIISVIVVTFIVLLYVEGDRLARPLSSLVSGRLVTKTVTLALQWLLLTRSKN